MTLGVCLLEGKIGWMKNFREKMEMKTFLKCIWLGRKEKK